MGYPKDFFVRTGAEKTEQRKVEQLRAKLDRLGRLSDSEKGQLEKSRLISTRATRRVALGRAGAAIIGGASVVGLAAAGLDPFGDSVKQPEGSHIAATPNPEKLPTTELKGKERMLHEIDSLPSSKIKQLLQERVSPFFSQDPPFTGTFGDMKFPVYNMEVVSTFDNSNDPTSTGGTYTSRAGSPPEEFHLPQAKTFLFPLVGILKSDEAVNLPNTSKSSDGTVLYPIPISSEDAVYEGYSPRIEVYRASDFRVPSQYKTFVNNVESFSYIKEACTFLLEGMVTQLVFEKLMEMGISTEIEVAAQNGTRKTIQIVPQLSQKIHELNGRSKAGLDAGGHIIAFKAIEGTGEAQILRGGKLWTDIIDNLSRTQLGNTIPEIAASSYAWSVDFLKSHTLHIQGDITKIP